MKYDFSTRHDRSKVGAYKYVEMQTNYPDIPADTVPFSMADMEFKNPPPVVEGIKNYVDRSTLGYCDATAEFRAACCDFQKRWHDWDIAPEWLLPIPGVLPGLFAVIQELTQPGDGIIYFSPVFGWFKNGAAMNERVPVPCSLLTEDRNFSINFEQFEKLAQNPANKAVIFCNPHNPTGHVWTEEELRRVAEICYENDLLLISDEVHADLVMPGYHQIAMGALDTKYHDNLVVCIAPSKTFNAAGMQAANLVIPNEAKRQAVYGRLCRNGLFVLTALGYESCRIAYSECDEWLKQCIAQIWENHLALKEYVAKNMPGVKVFDLEATYLQWMDFAKVVPDHATLAEKLHKACVIMDQGTDFGPEGDRFERMNLACPKPILMAALERMKKVLYE